MTAIVDKFVSAIAAKKKLRIAYVEDGHQITSTVAPLDYGRIDPDAEAQFSVFDFDAREQAWYAVLPGDVLDLEVLDETFSPADVIDWDVKESPWMTPRQW